MFKSPQFDIQFPNIPEVKFNKNGYEIRTEVLGMANDLVQAEYSLKFQGWKFNAVRDKTGQIVTTVDMPQHPGVDQVLDTAKKMYDFVNQNPKK